MARPRKPHTPEPPLTTAVSPREPPSKTFSAALEAAKLESLYQFAYGLSHEINNPLANIATRAETLLVDEKDPDRRKKLTTIVQQAFRAHEMIADLMLFARPPKLHPERTDLLKLTETVLAELREQAKLQNTRLLYSGSQQPISAEIDPVQIAVALKALMQNSLEALRDGGTVEVTISKISSANENGHASRVSAGNLKFDPPHPTTANWLALSVADDGPGISPQTREHIFDPYFSGREAGRGLGLGLSKAWRIVNLHGGRIDVASDRGLGARFTVLLPA